jgi:arylsulfatase A-like enzyme
MRASVIVILLVCASCTGEAGTSDGSAERAGSPREARPNILIIITDDQRADRTLGVMPATHRLFVQGGTKFVNAYATTPQCCPSRATIFTGLYAHNHGVLENEDGDELDHESTLQNLLQDAGYSTAIAGKFLQGRPVTVDPPHFDRWATTGWGYTDRLFNIDGRSRIVHRYSTDFIAAVAVRWLEEFEGDDRRPWLMYVAPTAPHLPYEPEPSYAHAKVPQWNGNPATGAVDKSDKVRYVRISKYSARSGAGVLRQQLRTLMSVDDLVARVFRTLGRLHERSRTLAIFVSDNGHLHGELGLFGKRLPYRPAARIPLLIRWPGHVAPGAVDHRLAGNLDLAPTAWAAAASSGQLPRRPWDGMSLLGTGRHEELLLEQYKNGYVPDWASVVTVNDQYIEYVSDSGKLRHAEYYDLDADPWQLDNLIDNSAAANRDAAGAARRLDAIRDCVGAECP